MVCQELVVKVASRCNLNCTYCYVYNLGDTTYKKQPKFMSEQVVDFLLLRIKDHCKRHDIEKFSIVFHGGEPLLASKEFYVSFVKKTKKNLSQIDVQFKLQTNGTLVTDEWSQLMINLDIGLGFSMDGTKVSHDMYRIDHAGKGSYDDVVKGIKTYQKHHPDVGVISVLNFESDPIEIYENMKSLNIKKYNILLPDYIYETRPKYLDDYENAKNTPIGDWLIRLFDSWFYDKSRKKPSIDMFTTFIYLILGIKQYGNELYGEQNNTALVIETNGDIEAVDTLKSCGNGFTKAGINIFNNEIDDAFDTDLARAYHYSHENLCTQCNVCPIKSVCGGGYLVHRYSRKNGFNNPSLYCKDLMKIITHIQNCLFKLFPQSFLEEAQISPMDYFEVRDTIKERIIKNENTNSKSSLLESFRLVSIKD